MTRRGGWTRTCQYQFPDLRIFAVTAVPSPLSPLGYFLPSPVTISIFLALTEGWKKAYTLFSASHLRLILEESFCDLLFLNVAQIVLCWNKDKIIFHFFPTSFSSNTNNLTFSVQLFSQKLKNKIVTWDDLALMS